MKKVFSALAILSLLAVSAFGQSAVDYYDQGVSNENAGALADALTDYTKAIQLKPDYAAAFYNRGVAGHHKGDAVVRWPITIKLFPYGKQPFEKIPVRNRGCKRGLKKQKRRKSVSQNNFIGSHLWKSQFDIS